MNKELELLKEIERAGLKGIAYPPIDSHQVAGFLEKIQTLESENKKLKSLLVKHGITKDITE